MQVALFAASCCAGPILIGVVAVRKVVIYVDDKNMSGSTLVILYTPNDTAAVSGYAALP